jgi:MFS family permease
VPQHSDASSGQNRLRLGPRSKGAGRPASPLRRALARRGFRRFFVARTISQWGDTFNAVALVILVYRLTGSGLRVAGTVVFEIVPVLVFGFVAGLVVDRLPRRRVMVAADLGRAAVAVALVLLRHHLWAVYGAAFGLSTLAVFFNPAASSALPALVDDDEVIGANSAVWSAAVVSQIALAPAASGLVALLGVAPAFLLNAASFVISAFLLAGVRLPRFPPSPLRSSRSRWREAIEGVRVIRDSRFLAVLAVVQALAALSAGATSALLVVLAVRHLHAGAGRFGLLLGAIGVGAGFGPLILQKLVRDVRHRGLLFGPYILRGLVDLVLAATASFAAALGALAAYGVGTSTGNVTYNSVLQTTVDDRVRGRVFAFYDIIWQTARLASIGLGGWLVDTAGIRTVYLAGGLLLLLAGTIGLTIGALPNDDTGKERPLAIEGADSS